MAIGSVVAVGLAKNFTDLVKEKSLQTEKYVTIALEDDGVLGDNYITLDLAESIKIEYTTRISEKQTSRGRKTDNIHNEPVKVTIKGFISDAAVSILDRNKAGLTALSLATQFINLDPYLEGVAVEAAVALIDPPKASKQAYDKLLAIRDAKSPVSISTSLEHFKGLSIRSIGIPITYETGESLVVEITAIGIPFVTTTTALIDVSEIDGEKAKASGLENATDLGSSTPKSSILKDVTNFFGS